MASRLGWARGRIVLSKAKAPRASRRVLVIKSNSRRVVHYSKSCSFASESRLGKFSNRYERRSHDAIFGSLPTKNKLWTIKVFERPKSRITNNRESKGTG